MSTATANIHSPSHHQGQQNMTGNPNMTSNPQQHMTGNPNMTGNPQQHMTGNPQQHMTGNPNMTGNPGYVTVNLENSNPVNNGMAISRGMRPDAIIDWDKLDGLFVLNELGNKIRFTDIFKKQKTILFFVRHFLDFIAKEYVEDVAVIPEEYLQNADVRVVVIGPAPEKYVKAFKQLTGLSYTLYVDPTCEVYKTLGCKLTKDAGASLAVSKHIKSGPIGGVISSVWRAMNSERAMQGDVSQQGATFLMGPGNIVHFNHIDQDCSDHCSINDVLDKAGVMNVSFPGDPRVQKL